MRLTIVMVAASTIGILSTIALSAGADSAYSYGVFTAAVNKYSNTGCTCCSMSHMLENAQGFRNTPGQEAIFMNEDGSFPRPWDFGADYGQRVAK